jgi:hypothetical protein
LSATLVALGALRCTARCVVLRPSLLAYGFGTLMVVEAGVLLRPHGLLTTGVDRSKLGRVVGECLKCPCALRQARAGV